MQVFVVHGTDLYDCACKRGSWSIVVKFQFVKLKLWLRVVGWALSYLFATV